MLLSMILIIAYAALTRCFAMPTTALAAPAFRCRYFYVDMPLRLFDAAA